MKKPPEDGSDSTTGAAIREKVPVAVALTHDRSSEAPPRVVATGRGAVAEQSLQIGFANGVKAREDADLAEILAAVDLETAIPIAAFAAVAGIPSYLYRLNGRAAEPTSADRK